MLLLTINQYGTKTPSQTDIWTTITFWIALLFASEHFSRYVITSFSTYHPLLEIELNRNILARHIGVDFISCLIISLYGYGARRFLSQIHTFFWDRSKPVTKDYTVRMYQYIPEAQRCLTIFFAYQVKNLYDTLLWNDGPEFIFHHIMAGTAAYGGIYQTCGHVYALFFMGSSEFSTTVLVVLANFDPIHGIVGLDEAFPIAKVILAVFFFVTFVAFRCVAWPWVSYFFTVDVWKALHNKDDKEAKSRTAWFWTWLIILSSLTVLQFAWLIQIFVMSYEEGKKAGIF